MCPLPREARKLLKTLIRRAKKLREFQVQLIVTTCSGNEIIIVAVYQRMHAVAGMK